jgi:cystathionine beta-lyase/cystathionine gamma-synthase
VWYAGLADSPYRDTANRLLTGAAGVVSCVLKDPSREPLLRFYDTPMPALRKAPSLGSDTTLFCPYILLTYFKRDDAYLAQYGLPRHLLRFAVGCETDLAPLLADLDRGLRAACPAPAPC